MLKADQFEKDEIVGGLSGAAVVINDVRPDRVGNFDILRLYGRAASKLNGQYLDAGFTHLEEDEFEVNLFIPDFDATDDKSVKAKKRFNDTISRLTGSQLDADDPTSWMGIIAGGPLHEKLLACNTAYIKCNDYKDKKNWSLDFNVSKPPATAYNDFVKQYLATQAKKKAKQNGEDIPVDAEGAPAY